MYILYTLDKVGGGHLYKCNQYHESLPHVCAGLLLLLMLQLLVFCKIDAYGNPTVPGLLSLAGQMKMGRGLLMAVGLLEGDMVEVSLVSLFFAACERIRTKKCTWYKVFKRNWQTFVFVNCREDLTFFCLCRGPDCAMMEVRTWGGRGRISTWLDVHGLGVRPRLILDTVEVDCLLLLGTREDFK